jgi:hypothetical protein
VFEVENRPTMVDSGHNRPELSANQHKALAALLAHTRVEDAARASGLSARTIRRYLAEPDFARAYREQQRLLLSETTATLQRIAGDAAAAIEDSLSPEVEDKNLRLRAARTALEFLLRATETERKVRELEDVEERLEALERAHRLKELGFD